MDDDGAHTNDTADGERSRVAHEHLRGVGVVPQEADERAHHGADEDDQFLRARDVHDIEVGRIFDMARHIGQYAERYTDDGAVARRHAVHAVVEVGAVAHGGDDDDRHDDEENPSGDALVVAAPCHHLRVVKIVVLEEWDSGLGALDGLTLVHHLGARAAFILHLDVLPDFGVGACIEHEADEEAEENLPQNLELARQTGLILLIVLDIVVDEAQGAEPYQADEHQNHVDVAQASQQQTGHEDDHEP